jgi:serine protease AprX
MRHEDGGRRRQSAPGFSGGVHGGARGGARGNALWGGKGDRLPVVLAALVVLAVVLGAGRVDNARAAKSHAQVAPELLAAAKASPNALFDVIVQGRGRSSRDLADDIRGTRRDVPGKGLGLRRKFASLAGTSAQLTGRQLLRLAERRGILAITLDAKTGATEYANSQVWPASVGVSWDEPPASTSFPTIAIVDSGVQSGRSEFGSRLLTQMSFVSSGLNTPGDGRGHGTLVASIAANGGTAYAGAEPRANLVSLDVLDDQGNGRVSDVIAACEWILAHKDEYNIRVANLSLNAGGGPFHMDPLDRAVEMLWLNGIVVVVAAGNHGTSAGPTEVLYSPANDPFVITVGASHTRNTLATSDDNAAPWSAWGYTADGFLKPELSAPGRWMRGAVPSSSSLKADFAVRSLGLDNMWMSGTSFAAPVVSGLSATILSRHPSWTPDQVKGALMLSASVPAGYTSDWALGVGVVNGAAALATSGAADPNAGLNEFVSTDSTTGLRSFDGAEWLDEVTDNPAWNSASWSSASWSSASWSSASWSSASWSSASWSSASWSSASWSSASWANNAASEEPEPGG